MAVLDDVKSLAAEDVVYLSRSFRDAMQGSSSIEVYRGRLRQALDGNWVFNASVGQNGILGYVLGVVDGSWQSSESPAGGLRVDITRQAFSIAVGPMPPQFITELLTVSSVIPAEFAD
jgi:hypothetical protein